MLAAEREDGCEGTEFSSHAPTRNTEANAFRASSHQRHSRDCHPSSHNNKKWQHFTVRSLHNRHFTGRSHFTVVSLHNRLPSTRRNTTHTVQTVHKSTGRIQSPRTGTSNHTPASCFDVGRRRTTHPRPSRRAARRDRGARLHHRGRRHGLRENDASSALSARCRLRTSMCHTTAARCGSRSCTARCRGNGLPCWL